MKLIYLFIPIYGMFIGSKQPDRYIYDNVSIYMLSLFAQAIYFALIVISFLLTI